MQKFCSASALILVLLYCYSSTAYIEVDVQGIEQLDDKKYVIVDLKIRKEKKERKIFGSITTLADIDNSVRTQILLYKKQGGEYRKMPYKMPEKGICDFFNDDDLFYPDVASNSDFPLPFPCPLKAMNYSLNGVAPTLKNVPRAIMTTGDYAAEVIYTKEGKEYMRTKFFASIINIIA